MKTAPDIKTPLPGPKAKAIIEKDAQFVSPSYTRDYPLVIARGEGAVVEDVDGNVFLDCAAGIAVNSTGVSHPDVVKAIADQAAKFIHMSGTDFYYEPQVRLAEEMASIVPIEGNVRSFFANSGTETTEAALKLSRYHTKRSGVIAFLGSFHGRSLGALALTSSKAVQRRGFGPFMPGVYHAPFPDVYRFDGGADACAEASLSFIRQQILVHLISPDEVAAMVVEPIQGEGGYISPPKAFLQGLRELTTQHGMHAGARRGAVRHGPDGEDVRLRALRRQAATSSTSRRASRRACRSASPARAPTSWTGRRARTRARSAATRSPAPPRSPRSTAHASSTCERRRRSAST